MKSDVENRTKNLEEEAERAALAELEKRFSSERQTMEAAISLRRQEFALEREVEMEQRISKFVKKREKEMLNNLERQFSKRGTISEKDISEMLEKIESEIKVKMESLLLDSRQNIIEKYNN